LLLPIALESLGFKAMPLNATGKVQKVDLVTPLKDYIEREKLVL
jgi:hypothetical protein